VLKAFSPSPKKQNKKNHHLPHVIPNLRNLYVVPLSNTKEDILKNILLFHDPKGISSFENEWMNMLLYFTTWIKSEEVYRFGMKGDKR